MSIRGELKVPRGGCFDINMWLACLSLAPSLQQAIHNSSTTYKSINITSNQGAVIDNKLVVKFAPFSHQAATFPELCVKGMIYMRLTL